MEGLEKERLEREGGGGRDLGKKRRLWKDLKGRETEGGTEKGEGWREGLKRERGGGRDLKGREAEGRARKGAT